MSHLRRDIETLIENSNVNPSLFYWTQILTLFELHANDLDIDDVRLLCAECERCRVYWNTDKKHERTIIKNGKEETLSLVKKSLDIEQENIFPTIYAHLAEMEKNNE